VPSPTSKKAQSEETERTGKAARSKPRWRENVESLGTAVILFLIVRTFFIQAFRIPSESMEDTLLKGDFLFVNKFLYGAKIPFLDSRLPGVRDVNRGDVVVFKSPTDGRDYIKRCVAVEGDTLAVRDNTLYINGEAQVEPYVKFEGRPQSDAENWPPRGRAYVIPEDYFFAMGDNRNNSSDSRFFASRGRNIEPAVPEDLLVGKAIFIYCSLDPERYYLPRLGRMFRAVR
jgi:signal peptidase I